MFSFSFSVVGVPPCLLLFRLCRLCPALPVRGARLALLAVLPFVVLAALWLLSGSAVRRLLPVSPRCGRRVFRPCVAGALFGSLAVFLGCLFPFFPRLRRWLCALVRRWSRSVRLRLCALLLPLAACGRRASFSGCSRLSVAGAGACVGCCLRCRSRCGRCLRVRSCWCLVVCPWPCAWAVLFVLLALGRLPAFGSCSRVRLSPVFVLAWCCFRAVASASAVLAALRLAASPPAAPPLPFS